MEAMQKFDQIRNDLRSLLNEVELKIENIGADIVKKQVEINTLINEKTIISDMIGKFSILEKPSEINVENTIYILYENFIKSCLPSSYLARNIRNGYASKKRVKILCCLHEIERKSSNEYMPISGIFKALSDSDTDISEPTIAYHMDVFFSRNVVSRKKIKIKKFPKTYECWGWKIHDSVFSKIETSLTTQKEYS